MADPNPTVNRSNEVLAPTLLWALLPIALNTMTQPSGRILGFPSWYNFALRISPVVCAVNAISTLVELLCRIYVFKSVKTACLGIAAHRFESSEDAHDEHGEFYNLRRNSVFRIGLFVLGALPQAIMLYASKGIPWAQGCCTAYLASFVVDEAVLYLASRVGVSRLATYEEALPLNHLLRTIADDLADFQGLELSLCGA